MDFTAVNSPAIWLTLKLALMTTFILLLLATPLAWWLANTSSRPLHYEVFFPITKLDVFPLEARLAPGASKSHVSGQLPPSFCCMHVAKPTPPRTKKKK